MIQGGSLFVIKSPDDFAPLKIGDQLIVDLQARYSNKTQVVNPISLFDRKGKVHEKKSKKKTNKC